MRGLRSILVGSPPGILASPGTRKLYSPCETPILAWPDANPTTAVRLAAYLPESPSEAVRPPDEAECLGPPTRDRTRRMQVACVVDLPFQLRRAVRLSQVR